MSADAGVRGVAGSYNLAAWFVIFGVSLSWLVLKQSTDQVSVSLPALPSFVVTNTSGATSSWLDLAESAYAAGRVLRPEGDSALYFYQQQLSAEPGDERASAGLQRVLAYLQNGAEMALMRKDWDGARTLARQALTVDPGSSGARSVLERVALQDKIADLQALAITQVEADRLTQPEGDNALHTYRQILLLDPENMVAKQGTESVAQRLAALAQREAFADNPNRARALIAMAKQIAPDAPGIEASEHLTEEWTNLAKDQSVKEDLMAAAQALQAGRLLSTDQPGQLGALDFYRSALAKVKGLETAEAGIDYVISSVLERAWESVRGDDLETAERQIQSAVDAGASQQQVVEVQDELRFLQRLQRNRAGVFLDDEIVPLSTLELRRKTEPRLADNAAGGQVELMFTVNELGEVDDIDVITADSEALQAAASTALAKWRFAPYEVKGRLVPARSAVRLRIER